MALPHRPQRLRRFIKYHELTYADAAQKLGMNVPRLANLIKGHVYPTPAECDAIEALFFPIPIDNMFEPDLLVYRHNWPPVRGPKAALDSLRAQIAREAHEAGE